jgi:hypothetical protein
VISERPEAVQAKINKRHYDRANKLSCNIIHFEYLDKQTQKRQVNSHAYQICRHKSQILPSMVLAIMPECPFAIYKKTPGHGNNKSDD